MFVLQTCSMSHQDTPVRILRQRVTAARIGVHPSTLWRWERTGNFPRRVRLGPNTVGYREADIERWIDDRAKFGRS